MNFLTNRGFIKDESIRDTSHYSTLTSTRKKNIQKHWWYKWKS